MLFTRRGDDGKTSLFAKTPTRISKSSCHIEALGCLDEINSFLGLCRAVLEEAPEAIFAGEKKVQEIVLQVQEDLFVIQAQLAGAEKEIRPDRTEFLEDITNFLENNMPEIKNFSIPGGSSASALFDFSRTIARRCERRVLEFAEKSEAEISKSMLSYLNRLSSLLFALARYTNSELGVKEKSPKY